MEVGSHETDGVGVVAAGVEAALVQSLVVALRESQKKNRQQAVENRQQAVEIERLRAAGRRPVRSSGVEGREASAARCEGAGQAPTGAVSGEDAEAWGRQGRRRARRCTLHVRVSSMADGVVCVPRRRR